MAAGGGTLGHVAQHIPLDFEDPVPEEFFDAIQEMLSGIAVNFLLRQVSPTIIKVVAGAGHDQVSLSIGGAYRFITADAQVAHPGGAGGIYSVWATSLANQAPPAAGPAGGDHTFGLAITSGAAPAGAGISRQVGRLVWNGSAILQVITTVGGSLAPAGDTIVGVQMPWVGSGDPADTRFLLADGRLLDSASYPEFDGLCGQNASGADKHRYNQGVNPGSGKVRMPDKRGRASIGADNMGTSQGAANRIPNSNRVAGQNGGEERHVLTATESGVNPNGSTVAHSHSPGGGVSFLGDSGFLTGYALATAGDRQITQGNTTAAAQPGLIARTADVAHNNMQPYEVDNMIVRVK
jgi:hypothetical protein